MHDQITAYYIVICLFPHLLQEHHESQREKSIFSFFVSVVASGHKRFLKENNRLMEESHGISLSWSSY